MSVAVITGSAGLIGSAAARFFAGLGMDVVGIDNDIGISSLREGGVHSLAAETSWSERCSSRYRHVDADVRDSEAIDEIFGRYGHDIALVIHTAAQP